MTTSQLYAVMIGILGVIVLIAAIIRLRRRSRAARHGEHLVVDMARPETIAETGVPDRSEEKREG
ncbi:hypothetical protein [Allosphingosinicella sp.]|uniref:hypothetical protein n=1 Tax=Allosphingosinicella sp. TaxID=2823234 RepID=UPI002EE47CBF